MGQASEAKRMILFAAVAMTVLAPVCVTAAPSVSIGDYVLVADEEINAKNLTVQSGDLAVNAGELRSHGGILAPSSRLAADHVDIASASSCSELYANDVVSSGGACGTPSPFSGPIFPDLAAACGFPETPPACSGQSVVVAHRQTRTLPPGVYGDLFVTGGSPGRGTVILEGGDYVFCNVHLGPRARILARGPATVAIVNDVNFGLGSSTGPAAGSGLDAADIAFFVSAGDARFQRRADLVGTICVPKGDLWLMHGSTLEGRGVARSIRTGQVTVKLGGGTTTTTIGTPTTTSTSTTIAGSTSTSTSSSTSSTIGGATSTSTTSTTSSTNGSEPSTTSTSIASTTSSTGVSPSTTSTSSTSSSSAPTPTTSSTSTSSTTSSTAGSSVCGNSMTEGAETCDDGNTVNTDSCPSDCIADPCAPTQTPSVTLSVNLVTDSGDSFGVGTVFIDYPEGLGLIPGSGESSEVQGAITNRPTTGSPTCLVNDRDHGLQFGCLSTAGFPEGLLFRAAFNDCDGGRVPTAEDFTCTILEASDTIGFPVSATCTLQIQ